jgi:hypothetical protein
MSTLRAVTIGTKVLIVHPPENFEGFTQEGTVVGFDDKVILVEFQADTVRHASFYLIDGRAIDLRLKSFIVLAHPQRF